MDDIKYIKRLYEREGVSIREIMRRTGYHYETVRKYLDMEDCPFAYVLFIKFYDFFEVCDVASSAYLPHTSQSRLDCQSCSVMELIFLPLIHCRRTGSYKAHVAF